MKWIRFTLETHTDAVDILSYMLDEIGVEGIEIEDHIPLTEEEKRLLWKCCKSTREVMRRKCRS